MAPGIILPPEAINPPPGNKPPGPGNDNGESPTPTTGDPTSPATSTGSTSTPEITTLGPVGRLIVETAPSRAEFSHLRGTVAQTLGTKLADLYGSEQRRATDGTYYSKPTMLPPTATTGIAVASYELCKQGNCKYLSFFRAVVYLLVLLTEVRQLRLVRTALVSTLSPRQAGLLFQCVI